MNEHVCQKNSEENNMSKLLVEVCRVGSVEPHPKADRLAVCSIKGWKSVIKYDPETKISQFKEGDLCVYFPPDCVLPDALANGPDDPVPGRLGVRNYLKNLPKNLDGTLPTQGRVVAARLRGIPSYGLIMAIDPAYGDDPNWAEGTDVMEHFGVTKYDPPPETTEGDEERPNTFFHKYTNIENYQNYPDAIPDGDEVVVLEKIHGANNRVGMIIESDENGNSDWMWAAGSHGVRRKEFALATRRFKLDEVGKKLEKDEIFEYKETKWQVTEVVAPSMKFPEERYYANKLNAEGQSYQKRSEYWEPLTDNVKALISHVKEMEWPEEKHSVIVFGEIMGVQDMKYGLTERSYRMFDISINNIYLDYDLKCELSLKFGVPMAPLLYRGPFNHKMVEEYTAGPTTMCKPEEAGSFKGREGIVITPVKEVPYCNVLGGRRILKSVSADYHARKGGTENH